MKLDTFSNDVEVISWLQTLTYEQRNHMFTNGCIMLHGSNPVQGKLRKKILAQTFAVISSYKNDPNPIVQQKFENDFQRVKKFINQNKT